MLRLSILTLSYRQAFDDGRMDLMSFLDTCRELSVEGVDLHDSAFPAVDRASLLAVKRDCLDRGLDIPCIAISNNFARPAEELPADVQRTKTWIERAALLGAPQVRVFSGKPFSEDDRAASWDRCADALRECAEFGAEVGVVVSLQNHNHNQIAPDGEDVLRLIRQVDHPNLGHVLDTGQYAGSPGASGFADDEQRERHDYLNSIALTAPLATAVRAKLYRIATGREESLDYETIFQTIRSVRYNGWISLVYEGRDDPVEVIPLGVRYLRGYLPAAST
ncbi:MAG: sugar phosphate isomerase/epimerase [Chloroflexota bacterium]|nr:sugar phosphate isomerase/epimerase [Chloroflexota bacterium]